jgi:hypothetical protein
VRTIATGIVVAAIGAAAVGAAFAQTAAGTWVYGNHPVLGRSAHVVIGNQAVGFACNNVGSDLARDDVVAWRATHGLAPANTKALTGKIDNMYDIWGYQTVSKRGYVETTGNPCETGVEDVGKAKTLTVIADGRAKSVPTKGSSAAIRKLIAACPRMKQEIEWNCGH